MKLSDFIKRLEELRTVIGQDDPEVVIGNAILEPAAAEIQNCVPIGEDRWQKTQQHNEHQVIKVF